MGTRFNLSLFVLLAAGALILSACGPVAVNISGNVWFDMNADGIRQGEEPLLEGILVQLLDPSDNVLGTETTDAEGSYLFADEVEGVAQFRVQFELPGGHSFSPRGVGDVGNDSDPDPTTGLTELFTAECAAFGPSENECQEAGLDLSHIDAGIFMPAESTELALGDFVWLDENANGIQDDGEAGVEGVVVSLLNGEGDEVASTLTDASGHYSFSALEAGLSYSVRFDPPEGHAFTIQHAGGDIALDSDADPANGESPLFDLDEGTLFSVDAGLVEVAEEGEMPEVLGPDPEDFPEGSNPLTGMPLCEPAAKDWGVVGLSISHFPAPQTRPSAWLSWAAWVTEWWIGDGDTRMYAMFYGCYPEVDPGLNFVSGGDMVNPPAVPEEDYWIGNLVWYDANGNSLQDAGEPGVPGVTVALTTADGSTIDTTVTDQYGLYWFNVERNPGSEYRIRFSLPTHLPYEFGFVEQNASSDDGVDSDAHFISGLTGVYSLPEDIHSINHVDAGIRQVIRSEAQRSGRIVFQDAAKYFSACSVIAGLDPQFEGQINVCGHATSLNAGDIGGAGIEVNRLKDIAKENVGPYGPPNLSGNLFSSEPPAGGQEAHTLTMYYNVNNITEWRWDAASGQFMRHQNSPENPETFEQSVESLTGEALGFENVIVLYAPHTQLNGDGTVFDIDMDFAVGPAKIFRDGMVYEVHWSTVSGEYEQETGLLRPIRFTYPDGSPFPLKPGQLWIHMVHSASGFWQPEPGMWRARWYAPVYEPGG